MSNTRSAHNTRQRPEVSIRTRLSMWISKRTDYATRAVLALAVADRSLKLEEISEIAEAPRSVLEQVMPTLRTAGLVRSVRGPGARGRGRRARSPVGPARRARPSRRRGAPASGPERS